MPEASQYRDSNWLGYIVGSSRGQGSGERRPSTERSRHWLECIIQVGKLRPIDGGNKATTIIILAIVYLASNDGRDSFRRKSPPTRGNQSPVRTI